MADNLVRMAKQLESDLKGLGSELEAVDQKLQSAAEEIAKKRPPAIVLKGLVAAYMEIVKDTDGLTAARPATSKALQAAESGPSASSLQKAVGEMEKHIADVEKESKKDKKAAVFAKAMEGLIKKTEALI